ncbi:MAG TPA: tetratricopeptide repeat protein, partial [Pirellulaceae bacterium]
MPYLYELVGWNPEERAFEDEKALAPEEVDAYLMLAVLMQQHYHDNELSSRIVAEMLKRNPQSAKAHILYGNYAPQFQPSLDRDELARRMAVKAMELAPDDLDSLIYSNQVALLGKDYVRSKALMERARELFPKRIEPYMGLFQWAVQQGKADQAIGFLQEGMKLDPKNPELLWRMASLQLEQRKMDEFEKTLADYRGLKANPAIADFLEGLKHRQAGEWLQAAKILNGVR